MVTAKQQNAHLNKCLVWLWFSIAVCIIYEAAKMSALFSGRLGIIVFGKAVLYLFPLAFLSVLAFTKKNRERLTALTMLLFSIYGLFAYAYMIANEGASLFDDVPKMVMYFGSFAYYAGVFSAFDFSIRLRESSRRLAVRFVAVGIGLTLLSSAYTQVVYIISVGLNMRTIFSAALNMSYCVMLTQGLMMEALLSRARFITFFMTVRNYLSKDRRMLKRPVTSVAFTMRSAPLTIFLMMMTFGFYGYYLIYRITAAVRFYKDDDARRPGVSLALAVFLPIVYPIYWFISMSKHINAACEHYCVPKMQLGGFTAFALLPFFPLLAGIYQSKINELIEANMENKGVPFAERRYMALRELSPARHVRYSIFTLGLYEIYFLYKTHVYCDHIDGVRQTSVKSGMLLSLYLPFYRIYWQSSLALRLDRLCEECSEDKEIYSHVILVSVLMLPIRATYVMRKRLSMIVAADYAQLGVYMPQHIYAHPCVEFDENAIPYPCSKKDRVQITYSTAFMLATFLVLVGIITGIAKQIGIRQSALRYIEDGQYHLAAAEVESGASSRTREEINSILYEKYLSAAAEYISQGDSLNIVKAADWLSGMDDVRSEAVRYEGIKYLFRDGYADQAFKQYLILTNHETREYEDVTQTVREGIKAKLKEMIAAEDIEGAKALASTVDASSDLYDYTGFVEKYASFFIVYNGWDWATAYRRMTETEDKDILMPQYQVISTCRAAAGKYQYEYQSVRSKRRVNVTLSFSMATDGTFIMQTQHYYSSITSPKESNITTTDIAYGEWKIENSIIYLQIDGAIAVQTDVSIGSSSVTLKLNEQFLSLFSAADQAVFDNDEQITFSRS